MKSCGRKHALFFARRYQKIVKVRPIKERPWAQREPGRLVGRGHPAGDFLEAYDWKIVDERKGFMRLEVHLPLGGGRSSSEPCV